jgi:hypothetical protein
MAAALSWLLALLSVALVYWLFRGLTFKDKKRAPDSTTPADAPSSSPPLPVPSERRVPGGRMRRFKGQSTRRRPQP